MMANREREREREIGEQRRWGTTNCLTFGTDIGCQAFLLSCCYCHLPAAVFCYFRRSFPSQRQQQQRLDELLLLIRSSFWQVFTCSKTIHCQTQRCKLTETETETEAATEAEAETSRITRQSVTSTTKVLHVNGIV